MSLLCPFNKVVGVLGVGFGEAGGVDGLSSDGGHDLCKVLGIECSTEGGIDSGDELLICLILRKAACQLGNEIRLFGIVGKRQHIQHLRFLCFFCRKSCGFHFILDGVHGILHRLQFCLFFGGEVFHHQGLQAVGVDLDVTVEQRYNGSHRHNDDNDHTEDDAENGAPQLFVGQYGDGNFLECGGNSRTHYRPPAFPKMAAL